MSKPKNMTPKQEAIWREKVRAQSRNAARKYRESHPEKARQATIRWRESNIEKFLETRRDWSRRNPDKVRKYFRDKYKKNPDRIIERNRAASKNLTNSYIAGTVGIPTQLLKKYPDLLEAKREQIKILRELKLTTRKKKQDA